VVAAAAIKQTWAVLAAWAATAAAAMAALTEQLSVLTAQQTLAVAVVAAAETVQTISNLALADLEFLFFPTHHQLNCLVVDQSQLLAVNSFTRLLRLAN
jgi:hypothetical protein